MIGLVVVVAPGQRQADDAPVATSPATAGTTTASRATSVAGLTPARVAEIERGCADDVPRAGSAVLRRYVPGVNGGDLAVIYTDEGLVTCTVDGRAGPCSAECVSVGDPMWVPGAFSADQVGVASGGDLGEAAHRGVTGRAPAVGRVTGQVDRVTYRRGDRSVEATIADGTYVAHIDHPPDHVAPGDGDLGVLVAYDAGGRRLGEVATEDVVAPPGCRLRPDGTAVLGQGTPNAPGFAPAVAVTGYRGAGRATPRYGSVWL